MPQASLSRVLPVALSVTALIFGAGCGCGTSAKLPDSFVVVRSQDNPTVPPENTFTELARLELQPGAYQVTGKVELHNRDGALPFNVQCGLVPSKPDGTLPPPGELGSDWGFLHLARSGEPGQQAGMALFASQELEQPGPVVLGCSGYGNQHGAFAAYTSIRAVEVGTVTSTNVVP